MFYYFGCIGQPGHYLWSPDGYHAWEEEKKLPWPQLDGTYAPADRRGRYEKVEAPQGHAALYHKDGWTLLAFWDRSIDTRGGCNSNFIGYGTFSFDDMLQLAKTHFPQVMARLPFPIILVLDDGKIPPHMLPVEEKARLFDGLVDENQKLRERIQELQANLDKALSVGDQAVKVAQEAISTASIPVTLPFTPTIK